MHPALGLFGAEPLQRAGIGARAIGDAQRLRAVEADRQRRALAAFGHRFAYRMGQRAALPVGDLRDLQPVGVEHDLLSPRRGQHGQFRCPADAPGVEIEVEIERDMRHPRDLRLRMGQRIYRLGRGEDRRDHRCGRRGRYDRFARHTRAGGRGKQDGEAEDMAAHWVLSCMMGAPERRQIGNSPRYINDPATPFQPAERIPIHGLPKRAPMRNGNVINDSGRIL